MPVGTTWHLVLPENVDRRGYNGGMDIGDWITLSAVIIALGLGIASILHTHSLQKKENKMLRVAQLIEEVKNWIIEIFYVASSGSPRGDDQERRNRKWRTENILLLTKSTSISAKKLDNIHKSEEKLEIIVNELAEIIRSHKSNPEVLMGGVQGSERIIDKITNKTDKALNILSNIRDRI